MRGKILVLPLVTLAGALFLASPASPAGQSRPAPAKQAQPNPPPKSTKADPPISKKESHMNERDREMDKRMKQKSNK